MEREVMADDCVLDLEELRHLHSIAKRPRIVSLLSSQIQDLEKLSKDAVPAKTNVAPPIRLPTATNSISTQLINYSTLGSFSWDQDNDKVKIYASLEGVDEEKIETVFKATSFDVKFHDVQGKNYRCGVPKLNGEIVPEKCKVIVKPSRVIITLAKASKGNWLDLHAKKDKLKPNTDKEGDPMAGIMDLMKGMYEEGDEDMKRTIAKAWTDARSGKGTGNDSLKGYR